LLDVADARTLQFKFHRTITTSQLSGWESDEYIRGLYLIAPAEVWTFEASPRVLYQKPYPAGTGFKLGDVLTFQVITQSAFRGARLYVWNPYNTSDGATSFDESAQRCHRCLDIQGNSAAMDDPGLQMEVYASGSRQAARSVGSPRRAIVSGVLAMGPPCGSRVVSATLAVSRSCSPCFDGGAVQRTARRSSSVPDQRRDRRIDIPVVCNGNHPYTSSPLFQIAPYTASIYPQAGYMLESLNAVENQTLSRPFPADPTVFNVTSRCALGASAWLARFPAVR
jgi:hypothetical protein